MAVASVTMFNIGCEKENMENLKQTSNVKKQHVVSDDEIMKNLPTVKDERLVFKNIDEFYLTLDWVSRCQDNPDKIYGIFGQSNFVSMNYIYTMGNRIIEDVDETNLKGKMQSYIEYVQSHPYSFYNLSNADECFFEMQAPSVISYIANEYGLYQIGDSIYRVSYEKEYIITDGNEDMINIVLSDVETSSYDNIIINRFVEKGKERSLNSEYILEITDKKRIKIRYYTTKSSGKWEYDVRLTGQNKVLGVWYNNQTMYNDTYAKMDKLSSYWYISGVRYIYSDANVWSMHIGGQSNYRFTAIITPSSTQISMLSSYMPYEVSVKVTPTGSSYVWNHDNVFAYNSGWNK